MAKSLRTACSSGGGGENRNANETWEAAKNGVASNGAVNDEASSASVIGVKRLKIMANIAVADGEKAKRKIMAAKPAV